MAGLIIPDKAQFLLKERARYKGIHGGRGSAKSWSAATALAVLGYQDTKRILCVREYQNSIGDSVHKLIADRIYEEGLGLWYDINNTSIRGTDNGTEFIFKGIKQSPQEIKSMEGIDISWYEEAQRARAESLKLLIPTVRKPMSELWFTWNPEDEANAIEQLLRSKRRPPNSIIQEMNWQDNPFFPDVLRDEKDYMLEIDPVAYEHVWGGGYLKISDAQIFKNRVSVESFTTPPNVRFRFGADWGFANDPTHIIRCYIIDEVLYIDYEARGFHVELDDLPALFDTIPEARNWPIKGDCSRPETISYVRRKGFSISEAKKWSGCVEDGIAHMKGFKRIVVHERCKFLAQEFRLYSFKVDKTRVDDEGKNLILPIIVDEHNHGIDATRYALDGVIQSRGNMGVWAKLAK